MHKRVFILLCLYAVLLWGYDRLIGLPMPGFPAPTETEHPHTFGQWELKETATCAKAGVEERICTGCQKAETRPTEKPPHDLDANNICKACRYAAFDPNAAVAELGVFSNNYYPTNPTANYVWDVKIWGDMVYRGAGDYDKNSGATPILAFDKAAQTWVQTDITADEAVQRFVEIDGTLYTPGIDATESWDFGNFYVLDGEKWQKVRNLPGGVHNFDMAAFDGKIFAGLGTETVGNTVAVSDDKGKAWTFAPLYRESELFDTTGYEFSRTYAFAEYDGSLYALLMFKKSGAGGYDYFVFRYNDGKMAYQSVADGSLTGHASRNYWQGRLEWNGVCYLATTSLNAITDFAAPETYKQIAMPNGEYVTDILLHDNALYVLSFTFQADSTYRVTVYKSATGAEGSFTAVTTFDYASIPLAFDFDGEHFYIGTGISPTDPSCAGMLLRVKA